MSIHTNIHISPDPLHRMSGPDRAAAEGQNAWGEDGFSFDDFLDFVNPLQHIPGVSTLYRAATGDDISPAARVLGGTLLAGPVGMIAAIVTTVIEQETGSTTNESALSLISNTPTSDAPATLPVQAAASPVAPPAPTPRVPAAPKLPDTLPPPTLPEPSAAREAPGDDNASLQPILQHLGLLQHSMDTVRQEYQKMQTLDKQHGALTDLTG